MKKSGSVAIMAAAFAVVASTGAHAQTKAVQPAPQARQELDPAKRVPEAPRPVIAGEGVQQPVQQPARQAAPEQRATVGSAPYSGGYEAPARHEDGRGGVFVGVQGGKGWVYDDVDQSTVAVNAGYRWQAGAVTLVGIEVAGGKLDSTTEDGVPYGDVDYTSVGVNARFNFGRTSPVFALVRAGYWSAEDDDFGMDVDGGYFGLGLGVDVNRHFNLSLAYTNYVYFDSYYWDQGYYEINRADTLLLGAEVRF